jgi:hypothetical protein
MGQLVFFLKTPKDGPFSITKVQYKKVKEIKSQKDGPYPLPMQVLSSPKN